MAYVPKPITERESPNGCDKFRDMARELEGDEDEAAFKNRVKKVETAPKPGEKP